MEPSRCFAPSSKKVHEFCEICAYGSQTLFLSAWYTRLNEILAKERAIDFDESDPTTLNYLKKFGLSAQLGRPRLFANNNELILNYFRRRIGFGTLTQEIAKPHLERGDLIALNGGSVMEDPLALAWYPRPELPAYFKAILSRIR